VLSKPPGVILALLFGCYFCLQVGGRGEKVDAGTPVMPRRTRPFANKVGWVLMNGLLLLCPNLDTGFLGYEMHGGKGVVTRWSSNPNRGCGHFQSGFRSSHEYLTRCQSEDISCSLISGHTGPHPHPILCSHLSLEWFPYFGAYKVEKMNFAPCDTYLKLVYLY
jgi:hypothetical protein